MNAERRRFRLLAVAVALLTGFVYVRTMHPGAGDGDAAELQHCSAVLGVCHPPGYPLLVLTGNLFARLPLGDDIAWRINFMTVFFGVVSVLLVFAIVARMTRSAPAALLAAGLLAFSSTAWGHALLAEVYTFYVAALLGALYSALRWVQTNRVGWLLAAAVLYGICVGNRPSEIFALPAFVALWAVNRRRVTLRPVQIAASAMLAALPFAISLGYYWVQATPANLSVRDNAKRDAAVDGGPLFHELTGKAKLAAAVRYCLGLRWTGVATMNAASLEQLRWDAGKYLWLISGLGASGDRFPGDDPGARRKQAEQGRGVNLTPIGALLAVIAPLLSRRMRRYSIPLALLSAGNLVFYLWHHPPDNLEFTLPSLAGLAMLAGIAISPRRRSRETRLRTGARCAFLVLPAALLAVNWNAVNEATDENRQRIRAIESLAALAFPENATIATNYPRATLFRYIFHVRANRPDIRVVFFPGFYDGNQRERLMTALTAWRGPVYLMADEPMLAPVDRQRMYQLTPADLGAAGFIEYHR